MYIRVSCSVTSRYKNGANNYLCVAYIFTERQIPDCLLLEGENIRMI